MLQDERGPVRVCVVEAQALFREAWRGIVEAGELELGAVAGTPDELPPRPCDVVVLDIDGQRDPCATLIRRIWSRVGKVPVCVVTLRPTHDVLASRAHGEAVLVLKTAPPSQVRAAIWAAARRERFDHEMASAVSRRPR
jgi:DNA-binding NarL/FixJ family response regulator